MHVACKRDNSHLLCYVVISLETEIFTGHNSHTVSDNLIIYGRDIYQVK